jgi:hypothetical protein
MMDFSKNDLSKAQKGDRLWNYFDQIWETVKSVELDYKFPIELGNGHSCDFKGRETRGVPPTYFWNEIHFDIPERPKRKVKKPVEFWILYDTNGRIVNFTDGIITANRWALNGDVVRHYTDAIEIEE